MKYFRAFRYPFLFGLPVIKQAAGLTGLLSRAPQPLKWSVDMFVAGHFLSLDPLIFCCQPRPQPFGPAHYLAARFPDQRFVFLMPITMSLERKTNAFSLAAQHRRFRKAHRQARLILLANTRAEEDQLRRLGVDVQYAPQNMFVDEFMYNACSEQNRIFDAIYNAQLAPFKRHELASLVPSCAYVTKLFSTWSSELKRDQMHKFIRRLPSGHAILNDIGANDFVQMHHSQVNQAMSAAHVGLCLSKIEGAMYASIEYLLAGLPVVSTPSQGGRDVFFHPDTTLIVDDNPRAVRDGVAAMKARAIPPDHVRATTLKLMTQERERFNAFVDELRDQQFSRSDPRWSFDYTHKLGGFGHLSKFESVVESAQAFVARSDATGTIGRIDTLAEGKVCGWSFRLTRPKERVKVRILVDGRIVAEGVADIYRRDMVDLGYGDGRCGFAIELPKELLDDKEHFVEAMDTNAGVSFRYISRRMRLSSDSNTVQLSLEQLFDKSFYEDQAGPMEYPLDHYREIGWRKGFDPHRHFSTRKRVSEYGSTLIDPLSHYTQHVQATGSRPSLNDNASSAVSS